MNNDLELEVTLKRDAIQELIAENYTREELFNLIVYCLNKQGNERGAALEIAANLELFAS